MMCEKIKYIIDSIFFKIVIIILFITSLFFISTRFLGAQGDIHQDVVLSVSKAFENTDICAHDTSSDGQYVVVSTCMGIFVSSNYGETWTQTNFIQSVFSLAISSDGQIMVGITNSGDLIKSENYGVSWTQAELPVTENSEFITDNFTDPFYLKLDATGQNIILYRNRADSQIPYFEFFISTNAGAFFAPAIINESIDGYLLDVAFSGDGSSIAFLVQNPDLQITLNQLYISTDLLETATPILGDPTIGQAGFDKIELSFDGTVLIAGAPDGLFIYENNNWGSNLELPFMQGGITSTFAISPDANTIVYTDGRLVNISFDRGTSWTLKLVPDFPESEQVQLVSNSSNLAYIHLKFNSQALYRMKMTPATWTELGDINITNTNNWGGWTDFAISSDGSIIVGVTSNAVFISNDGGQTWSRSTSAPYAANNGFRSATITADGSRVMVTGDDNVIHIYENDIWNSISITGDDFIIDEWGTEVFLEWEIASSADGNTIFAVGVDDLNTGDMYVYESTDGGQTWNQSLTIAAPSNSAASFSIEMNTMGTVAALVTPWSAVYRYDSGIWALDNNILDTVNLSNFSENHPERILYRIHSNLSIEFLTNIGWQSLYTTFDSGSYSNFLNNLNTITSFTPSSKNREGGSFSTSLNGQWLYLGSATYGALFSTDGGKTLNTFNTGLQERFAQNGDDPFMAAVSPVGNKIIAGGNGNIWIFETQSAIVPGCTIPLADNYNPLATQNDGSCVISGCTDLNATNYNRLATDDDGSCFISGCTDPAATNYNPNATNDNGSCILATTGCTDPSAFNYNANANTDDGSCRYDPFLGCTDPSAFNYDPQAEQDNGSCIPVVAGCTNPLASNYNPQANTSNGSCTILGCTDPSAFNYNPNANTNNGSCVPVVTGCTNPLASNYNPQANTSDNSCIVLACMNPTSPNYESSATQDNGSCIPPAQNAVLSNWQQRNSGLGQINNTTWADITASFNGLSLAAIRQTQGGVFISTNGGVTWTERQPTGESAVFQSVTMAPLQDNRIVVASGSLSPGTIYTSADYGATWTHRPEAGTRIWIALASSADGSRITAAAFDDYIHTSSDFGVTWVRQLGSGDRLWQDIAMSYDGSVIVAPAGNRVYISTNTGVTWNASMPLGSAGIRDIALSENGMVIAASTENGFIYVSTDRGETWITRTALGTRVWRDIALSSDGQKIAVIATNNVYISHDRGATWARQDISPATSLFTVITGAANLNRIAVGQNTQGIWIGSRQITGCTNRNSFNFNYEATQSDGNCIPRVFGCTNPAANNRNPNANTDDGSCRIGAVPPLALLNTLLQKIIPQQPQQQPAPVSPVIPPALPLTRNLTLTTTGPDVRALQQFLNANGFLVAENGAGSPGNESEFFGLRTREALIQFQRANNILPTGLLGPETRRVISEFSR